MAPAQQRLDADDPARGQVDLRLVVQRQLGSLDRLPQLAVDAQQFRRSRLQRLVEDLEAVATTILGAVHRCVGVLEHVERRRRRSEASATPMLAARCSSYSVSASGWIVKGSLNASSMRLATASTSSTPSTCSSDDHELVAAEVADEVVDARHGAQAVRRTRARSSSPARVPEAVVHDLEPVEIEEEHRGAPIGGTHTFDRVVEAFDDRATVRQTGQVVVARLMLEVTLGLVALDGDRGEMAGHADDIALAHRRVVGVRHTARRSCPRPSRHACRTRGRTTRRDSRPTAGSPRLHGRPPRRSRHTRPARHAR